VLFLFPGQERCRFKIPKLRYQTLVMIRYRCYLSLVVLLFGSACHNAPKRTTGFEPPLIKDTAAMPAAVEQKPAPGDTTVDNTTADDPMLPCFILVADTSHDYDALDRQLYALGKQSGFLIDTMNRHFNREKGRIALPDNDEDQMYAGEYYPRREINEGLSLEYLYWYTVHSDEQTIALIAGIYTAKDSANAALKRLRPHAPKACIWPAKIYMGCMH
jgi:hypothetical protein